MESGGGVAAFGGVISQGIDDVDWLIAEVKRLREENDRLQCGLDSCMETINLQHSKRSRER